MNDSNKSLYNTPSIHTGEVHARLLDWVLQDTPNSPKWKCFLRYFYLLPFRITVQYRFLQYMQQKKRLRLLTKLWSYRYALRTAKLGCYLEPETKIGPGVSFPHAFPLVIHSHTVIGKRCTIHPNVQIGTTRTKEGAPVIGDYCFLGNGCHIIGNCKIGDWCFISPGAFVCKDIPAGSVVGYGLNNIISDKGKETIKRYL